VSPELFIGKVVVLLGLAVALIYFGLRLKMPAIMGFLITGILAGPSGFELINEPHQVEYLSELGVVLLLFTIGLEFSVQSLLKIKRVVLLGGGLQMGLTILGALPLGILVCGLKWNTALVFAILVSLSSTAIVLKLLQDRGEMDSAHGQSSLGVLIFQDLAVVPILLFLPYLAGRAGSDPIYLVLAKIALIVVLVYVMALRVVPWVMLKVSQTRSKELFLFTVTLICLGTAFMTDKAGLSMALGAFLAGLIISGSQYAYQAIESILSMRDIFTSFFFVSVGLLMDISYLVARPFTTILLALGIMLFNLVATSLALKITGLSPRVAVMTGFALCQIGEFAFVLAATAAGLELLGPEQMKMFLNLAVLTMAMTPLSLALGRLVSPRFALLDENRPRDAAPPARDHAIVVGFGVAGQAVARACRYVCRPYYVIDMNPSSVQSFRKLGEPLFFGDAASAHLLEHVHIKDARVLVITIPDPEATRRIIAVARDLNPGLRILARTRFLLNIERLKNLGADRVVAEEFEAALAVFDIVLEHFNVSEEERAQQGAAAKKADPKSFRLLAGMEAPPPLDGVCHYDLDSRRRPKASGPEKRTPAGDAEGASPEKEPESGPGPKRASET
jgi:CPA2 family monovalent cation:H+ antiporter-2